MKMLVCGGDRFEGKRITAARIRGGEKQGEKKNKFEKVNERRLSVRQEVREWRRRNEEKRELIKDKCLKKKKRKDDDYTFLEFVTRSKFKSVF